MLDENDGQKSVIHNSMERIYILYGKKRRDKGGITILAGDQPTFKTLFWTLYDNLEFNDGDGSEWMFPIPEGFHNDKTGLIETVKYYLSGTGIESFLHDAGFSAKQIERFSTYGHARRDRHLLFHYAAASVVKLCDTLMMEDPSIRDQLEVISTDTHAQYTASFPEQCEILLDDRGSATQMVYQKGQLFVSKMKQLLEVKEHRKVRYHVGTVLLRMLIPYTAHYVFARMGQAKMVDKFLFHFLPSMMRTPKMLYSELIICYGFVKSILPTEVYESLYRKESGNMLIGRMDDGNTTSSIFHNEALEMNIIHHLKSLGYNSYTDIKKAVSWLRPFGLAYDNLTNTMGGRAGRADRTRHEDFDNNGFRFGYDRTKRHCVNIKEMLRRMDRTGHLGIDFIKEEHICNYASGNVVHMNDTTIEERLINVPYVT